MLWINQRMEQIKDESTPGHHQLQCAQDPARLAQGGEDVWVKTCKQERPARSAVQRRCAVLGVVAVTRFLAAVGLVELTSTTTNVT